MWEGVGAQAKGGPSLPLGHGHCAVLSVGDRDIRNPQDRSRQTWQQFDTTQILISAPQWLHRPCSLAWPSRYFFFLCGGGKEKIAVWPHETKNGRKTKHFIYKSEWANA